MQALDGFILLAFKIAPSPHIPQLNIKFFDNPPCSAPFGYYDENFDLLHHY